MELINSRRSTYGYRPIPQVPQAEHVTTWDEATPAERPALARRQWHAAAPSEPDLRSAAARKLFRAEAERRRVEAEQRRQRAEAERAAQFAHWGLTVEPRERPEPEHVYQEEQAATEERRTAEQVRARARASQGRSRPQATPGNSRGEQFAQRLLRNVRDEQ
ncbi:hypothetical protein [Streptomyces sp. NPDC007063]|uniref:hypothetical protein n=1 Tax=Streptomyces sp. NPDC007063 TaxID=3364772 RepID=UPI003674B9FB